MIGFSKLILYAFVSRVIVVIYIICCLTNGAEKLQAQTNINSLAQGDFKALQSIINQNDDTLRVLNFWATWCAPCIKELPYFFEVEKLLTSKPVRFYYISLDFKAQVQTKLIPFINRNMPDASVWWLYDMDMNTWIPKVDSSWSGNIPATLIARGQKRLFFDTSISSAEELQIHIKGF